MPEAKQIQRSQELKKRKLLLVIPAKAGISSVSALFLFSSNCISANSQEMPGLLPGMTGYFERYLLD